MNWTDLILEFDSFRIAHSKGRQILNMSFPEVQTFSEFRMLGTQWRMCAFMTLFEACNFTEKSDQYNLSKSSLCIFTEEGESY